jgi:hypothetical protein
MDAGKPKEIDFQAIFQRVEANRAKLDACPRHLFKSEIPGIEGGVGAMFGRKMHCERCNGEMDLVSINFYIRGYEAAGKSGNDIMPGWRPTEPAKPTRKFFREPPE